jgi:hypothetical protein
MATPGTPHSSSREAELVGRLHEHRRLFGRKGLRVNGACAAVGKVRSLALRDPEGPVAATHADVEPVGEVVGQDRLELDAVAVSPLRGYRAGSVIVLAAIANIRQVRRFRVQMHTRRQHDVGGCPRAQCAPEIILPKADRIDRDRGRVPDRTRLGRSAHRTHIHRMLQPI